MDCCDKPYLNLQLFPAREEPLYKGQVTVEPLYKGVESLPKGQVRTVESLYKGQVTLYKGQDLSTRDKTQWSLSYKRQIGTPYTGVSLQETSWYPLYSGASLQETSWYSGASPQGTKSFVPCTMESLEKLGTGSLSLVERLGFAYHFVHDQYRSLHVLEAVSGHQLTNLL